MKTVKVAILGFGGIGKLHNNSYRALEREGYKIKLCAVCEKNVESVMAQTKINLGNDVEPLADDVRIYSDVEELLSNEDFDLADICLPTVLHKQMTIKMLEAGKHVLCEKPMALRSEDCVEMVEAARRSGRRLMIAQCLRFDPNYNYFKKCYEDNTFGQLKYVTAHRLCDYPRWSPTFADLEKTGGCILDTHIHDIDVLRYILGDPQRISATAYNKMPFCQVVNSRLDYSDFSAHVECCWDESRAVPFEAGFRAIFENATLVCDSSKVLVYENGMEPYTAAIDHENYITGEIREIADLILDEKRENTVNSPESSWESVRLIEMLKLSAEQGGAVLEVK